MEKFFQPASIVIFGLSNRPHNIPKAILENLLRWGYMGRIFGVHPDPGADNVDGIKMYRHVQQLPVVPDLAVVLIPARYVPEAVHACGEFGIQRLVVLSAGFNEFDPAGGALAERLVDTARRFGIRFVGPNCLGIANTANGICLPFRPAFKPRPGGVSMITQSGGIGIFLWGLMANENVGLAKYASIGNKLDIDEVDLLTYFGRDPDTRIIAVYLESLNRGREFIETAAALDKPVVVLKANTTRAGSQAAMSHTASLSNDDDIVDAAFERAGIVRIHNYADFIAVAKAFALPPMRGKRMMVMSPAGGMAVHMADLCEKARFAFADPGTAFYAALKQFSNAGIIAFSNPLDMGDIYDPQMHAHIFFSVLHNENVDGAVYVTERPRMPREDDVFYRLLHTDLSKETFGAIQSSGKPMGVCLYGPASTLTKIKQNLTFPIFNAPEEMVFALKAQADYYARKKQPAAAFPSSSGCTGAALAQWFENHRGDVGEAALTALAACGIATPGAAHAANSDEAAAAASRIGFPVVLKVVSPNALHKTEAGGVITGLQDTASVRRAFVQIESNLQAYRSGAEFQGVRVVRMAPDGADMFVGGKRDPAFGPVVMFGYGGIYVEVFKDIQMVLCPSEPEEIERKLQRLRTFKILAGLRGRKPADVTALVAAVERISHLMTRFPQIQELDVNPLRVLPEGMGVLALDARMRLSPLQNPADGAS